MSGPPWNLRFAARVAVRATLRDGSTYRNTMTQWGRLRWTTLVDDVMQEDTVALARACAVQRVPVPSLSG